MTDRRSFLRGALAAGVAGAVAGPSAAGAALPGGGPGAATRPFHGEHQVGILERPGRRTIVASFDVIAAGPRELTELLRTLTDRARALTAGGAPGDGGIATPPPDSGVLGPDVPGGGLTATVGVGASLFDDRYGLAGRRPPGLTPMRTFPNDTLDPAWCHGDLSLQLSADDEDTIVHALRDVTRHTRGTMQVRWRMNGFASPPRPSGTPRNLMGFKDGIANPDVTDAREMSRLVWAAPGTTGRGRSPPGRPAARTSSSGSSGCSWSSGTGWA
ncbi:Dyp-type peroxidase [Actinoallomurus purpureus]|uniref:Dyp-type peroxidase n=1 Tax=Actinoallomurus purpureus TaxID=478114 RepID=UPI0020921D72|nr:Dyp-type peroxidase [Actinoallomurus purpureus]MCO6009622.1 Dyp-type peroxidase [Actinoallomurus purpureus]